ncbi:hypothetical protein BD626DRAFT_518897, partial [Schizophyllum amplum]
MNFTHNGSTTGAGGPRSRRPSIQATRGTRSTPRKPEPRSKVPVDHLVVIRLGESCLYHHPPSPMRRVRQSKQRAQHRSPNRRAALVPSRSTSPGSDAPRAAGAR